MDIFLVILDEDGTASASKVQDRIKEKFKENYYKMSDGCFIVASKQATTRSIAESVGIRGVDNQSPIATGAVFRSPGRNYSGFTDQSLWEWLNSIHDD